MVPANLKSEVMIKAKDRHCYHVQMTSVKINPADPTHPIEKTEVRPFRIQDYRMIFTGPIEEQIRKQKVIGIEKVEVVHDPTLEEKPLEVVKGPVRFTVKTDAEKIEEARLSELAKKDADLKAPKSESSKRTRKPKA